MKKAKALSCEVHLANIPSLPATIRYYDDFSDSYIDFDPTKSNRWEVHFDGSCKILYLDFYAGKLRDVVKSWCAYLLARCSPRTACFYCYSISVVPAEIVEGLLTSTPQVIRSHWNTALTSGLTYSSLESLKSLLSFSCTFGIGAWRPEWLDITSQLQLPKVDKYARVRSGDAFLTADEEAAIVRFIDRICNQIQTSASSISTELLQGTAILVCSFQFGLRAKQIAMLKMRDIRIWADGADAIPAVHLTFSMIKQRSMKRVFPMLRRVKREWSPLLVELFDRANRKGLAGADRVFQRTPEQVSRTVADLTESLSQQRRGTTELRHTAAQRLVDAGASEEELAAFMGHTDLNTGLIYFSSSPSQAARINQALGVSGTYQRVSQIAHNRFISPHELAELKGDQQIGGVPHGIPIAGIGGCSLGQPSCPYNPVMSCYGCGRFMPIAVSAVHQQVLEDLRDVMKFFYSSSHAERGSPAFQLARTISEVQAVLDDLGGQHHELQS